MTSLKGKTLYVSGGSRGIGLAIALRAARDGANVAIAAKTAEPHPKLKGTIYTAADEVRAAGGKALPIICDIREEAQVIAAIDQTVAEFGGIDIVIANAGVGSYGPFVELDPAHLDEMMDVNAKGVITTAAVTVPHLIARGGGDFVSVASEAGRRGLPFEAVYCASKFAQVGFTRALDHELRPQGVRCTNVCPGGVATDFAMEEGYGRTPDMPELAGPLLFSLAAFAVASALLWLMLRPDPLLVARTIASDAGEEGHPHGSLSEALRVIGSSEPTLTPLIAGTSVGAGRKSTTASSSGCTPLFLKAEPHKMGTKVPAIVPLRMQRFSVSASGSSPPR